MNLNTTSGYYRHHRWLMYFVIVYWMPTTKTKYQHSYQLWQSTVKQFFYFSILFCFVYLKKFRIWYPIYLKSQEVDTSYFGIRLCHIKRLSMIFTSHNVARSPHECRNYAEAWQLRICLSNVLSPSNLFELFNVWIHQNFSSLVSIIKLSENHIWKLLLQGSLKEIYL